MITRKKQVAGASRLWLLSERPHGDVIYGRVPSRSLGSRGFSLSESWDRNYGRPGTGSEAAPALPERETSSVTQGSLPASFHQITAINAVSTAAFIATPTNKHREK